VRLVAMPHRKTLPDNRLQGMAALSMLNPAPDRHRVDASPGRQGSVDDRGAYVTGDRCCNRSAKNMDDAGNTKGIVATLSRSGCSRPGVMARTIPRRC